MKHRICSYNDGIHSGYCIQAKPWWSFGFWIYARRVSDNNIAVYKTLKEAKQAMIRLFLKHKIKPIKEYK